MGTTVSVPYFIRDGFEVSEDSLEDFYDFILEHGWNYESEEHRTGYFVEDNWIFDSSFSEAVREVTRTGSGAITLNKDNIEGAVFFCESWIRLNFDATNFRREEVDGREIAELMQLMCQYFDVEYMYGDSEWAIEERDSIPEEIEKIQWANYFSKEILQKSQNLNFEDVAEIVKDINGGVFILSMIKPVGAGGHARDIEEINEKLGLV